MKYVAEKVAFIFVVFIAVVVVLPTRLPSSKPAIKTPYQVCIDKATSVEEAMKCRR